MKFITVHEYPHGEEISINPEMIFTMKQKGKGKAGGHEGTIINGSLTIQESVDEIKSLFPRQGRKTTF